MKSKIKLTKKKFVIILLLAVGVFIIVQDDSGIVDCPDCKIKSAHIDPNVKISLPFFGDVWASVQGSDGLLYMNFGDATGQDTSCVPVLLDEGRTVAKDANQCIDLSDSNVILKDTFCLLNDCENTCFTETCQFTPAGLVVMSGHATKLKQVGSTSIHIPYGDSRVYEKYDKIMSMEFIGSKLYATMGYSDDFSSLNIVKGYIAVSNDKGKTWDILKGVEWSGDSNFKVLMFLVNHDKDNFVYILGLPTSLSATAQDYGLMRVDKNLIQNISEYQYFTGTDANGNPTWSKNEFDFKPLDGLGSLSGGSGMYHEGLDRYLFLSPLDQIVIPNIAKTALYESKTPYGEWHKVASFNGGFVSMIMPAHHTNDEIYFTGASVFCPDTKFCALYNLNIGRMIIETSQ